MDVRNIPLDHGLIVRWSDVFEPEEILTEDTFNVTESILTTRSREAAVSGPASVELYTYVSEACAATGFSTGIAKFKPGAHLPYHAHGFSEAVTVLEGRARILVEGRAYRLRQYDCVHIPSGVAHQVENEDREESLVCHWAFATNRPTREQVDHQYPIDDRGTGNPTPADPETIVRYESNAIYELSTNAFFLDLFARRFGAIGICGGHGRFLPGASLPCHIHDFDESITIIKGSAVCLVQGRRYELSNCDTAFIPKGLPHRFLNLSDEEMSMVWVYAGSEPDRRIVDSHYCSGELVWPGADLA
jgi:quercetin dioxygenase-like cupin family protein